MEYNTEFENCNLISEGYAIAKIAGENRWAVIDETGAVADRFYNGAVENATFQIPLKDSTLANRVTFSPFKKGVSIVQVNGADPIVGDNERRTLFLVSKSGFMRAFAYDNEQDRDWWFKYLGRYFDSTTSFLARTPAHLKTLPQLGFYSDIAQHGLLMRFEKLEKLITDSKIVDFKNQADLDAMNERIASETSQLNKDAGEIKDHFNYIFKSLTSGYKQSKSNFRHRLSRFEPVTINDVRNSIESVCCGPANIG